MELALSTSFQMSSAMAARPLRRCGSNSLTAARALSSSFHLCPLLLTMSTRKGIYSKANILRLQVTCAADPTLNDGKASTMTVSITGATGFIGRKLVQRLMKDGHTVRILTRSISSARAAFPEYQFPNLQIAAEAEWGNCIEGSTAVVNLAGTPISTRWSPEIKADIKNSRVRVTTKVVKAINSAPKELRPQIFVSATAVGFYGSSETETFDESSPAGRDYLAEVCRSWESTAEDVDSNARLVLLRIGVVLDKDGGALGILNVLGHTIMVSPFPLLIVGKHLLQHPGKDMCVKLKAHALLSAIDRFSWVHRDDLVNLIMEALSNPMYKGVINGTAPNPVRFAEMCDKLGAALGRPSWLPVPEFAVRALLGEGACAVLDGQRVVPKRATELGFRFKYPNISDALKAIVTN